MAPQFSQKLSMGMEMESILSMCRHKNRFLNLKFPFSICIMNGGAAGPVWNVEAIQALLASGGDLEQMRNVMTPLMWACATQRTTELVDQLIAKGARLDTKNMDGGFALFFAARVANPAIVKVLLEKGANVNDTDNGGFTPLMILMEDGKGDMPTLVELFKADVDINHRDGVGNTALHIAAFNEVPLESIQFLIDKGADRTILNRDYQTAWNMTRDEEVRLALGIPVMFGVDTPALLEKIKENRTNWQVPNLNITSLPPLPDDLVQLVVSRTYITEFPLLPASLIHFDCSYNHDIKRLPPLPEGLIALYCRYNDITEIAALPPNLEAFDCSGTLILRLPPLPATLMSLHCGETELTELPALPDSLQELSLESTDIIVIPPLPPALEQLFCNETSITVLPPLPNTLQLLNCGGCSELTALPNQLPRDIVDIDIGHCERIQALPPLPNTIEYLEINNTSISVLPELPRRLVRLNCADTPIAVIPGPLPRRIQELDISRTQVTVLPQPLPSSLRSLGVEGTPVPPLPPRSDDEDEEFVFRRPAAVPLATSRTLVGDPEVFDIVMQGDEKLSALVEEEDGDIPIVFKSGDSYTSTSYKNILARLVDNAQTYFECKEQLEGAPYIKDVHMDQPYFRLQLAGNFTIPLAQMMTLAERSNSMETNRYELIRTDKRLANDASFNVVQHSPGMGLHNRQVNMVSADHCQAGTEQSVYEIRILERAPAAGIRRTRRRTRRRSAKPRRHTRSSRMK